jgi:hypothetical protein
VTIEAASVFGVGVYSDSNGETHDWAWSAPVSYDCGGAKSAFTIQ